MTKGILVIDTETFLIGKDAVVPKLVCASFCLDGEEPYVLAAADPELEGVLEKAFQIGGPLLVFHNAAFDIPVIYNAYPALRQVIWAKLAAFEVTDTMLREQLMNLGSHGNLEQFQQPDGSSKRILYALGALVLDYLSVDISSAKEGDDAWRKSYSLLDGVLAKNYPAAAYEYAADDAGYTYAVFVKQDQKAASAHDSIALQGNLMSACFQTATACSLAFITERGMATDPAELVRLQNFLDHELSDENMAPLINSGVMIPAKPAVPYAVKEKEARATLGEWLAILPEDVDFSLLDDDLRETLIEMGIKFKKPTKASIKTKMLKRHVVAAAIAKSGRADIRQLLRDNADLDAMVATAEEKNVTLTKTATDDISAAAAVIQELTGQSAILQTYRERQKVQKLVSTEIPRMMWEGKLSPTVHFPYKTILETGRTSSHASKLYPSANGQNVDPRARGVYIPREGYVLASVDYSALELVCVAQTTFNMFGKSAHRDKIIAGYDLHAYLGARLAVEMASPVFLKFLNEEGVNPKDLDATYKAFKKMQGVHADEYKFYRKLAKPVGLGFPSGLGPSTMVEFSTTTYGMDMAKIAAERYETNPDEFFLDDVAYYAKKMDIELEWSPILLAISLAVQLRKIWLDTYPEMEQYFAEIRNMRDPSGSKKIYDADKRAAYEYAYSQWESEGRALGEMEPDAKDYGGTSLLCYNSPMGMRRARCTYTALSNGLCMQTPGAEGAKHAIIKVVRACKDPASDSLLLNKAHVVNFVHDELMVELLDDGTVHEQAMEVVRLMELGLAEVIKDVPVKAEPALMLRWSKSAEPVYVDGRLVPWQP